MSGRRLMIGLLAFTAVFAVALWYAQFHAFYREFEADTVRIAGRDVPVDDFRGIDADTSPLKLRACFDLPEAPEAPVATNAEPLVAPGWFDCFDARALTQALRMGEATAYLAEPEEYDGADRIVARFPDGRAYMWRQLTDEFAER